MANYSDAGSRGRGPSHTWVKPCCVLEEGTFTLQKLLVIPRKWWLCPNMTEKLFPGTLRIKSTNLKVSRSSHLIEYMKVCEC